METLLHCNTPKRLKNTFNLIEWTAFLLGSTPAAQEFYLRAVEISESCLTRHPASPQCNYHIGAMAKECAVMDTARESREKEMEREF